MPSEKSFTKKLYSFYKEHLSESPLFANAGHLWKLRLQPIFSGRKSCRFRPPVFRAEKRTVRSLSQLRLAVICDDMTWQCFAGECELMHITPQHWLEELEQFQPDAFFCESAWEGSSQSGAGWRWRVYRNHALWFENRRELLDVLRWCREAGVPTLFWNKEDPPAFSARKFDFIDTALRFDHIFTTAGECVKTYTDAGHSSVHTLMFGFSPRIFHPLPYVEGQSAVFHGSWYAIHPKRCSDMRQVFDMLLEMNMPLTIYDRQSGSGNPMAVFPEEYRSFVRPSVPYDKILETLSGQSFAVNINTITGSDTMFARRVFEMMACGLIVISNYSAGIDRLFGSRVWFAGQNFDFENRRSIRRQNIADVFLHHTWRQRVLEMLEAAGIRTGGSDAGMAVVYRCGEESDCLAHFRSLGVQGAEAWLLKDGRFVSLETHELRSAAELASEISCFLWADAALPADEPELMLALRQCAAEGSAVAHGGDFEQTDGRAEVNWLIPSSELENWVREPELKLPVYLI